MATDNELLGEILEQVELINQNLSGSDYDEVVGDAVFQDMESGVPLIRPADPLSVKVVVSIVAEEFTYVREDGIVIGIAQPNQSFVLPTAGKGEIALLATGMSVTQAAVATYRKLPS